MKPIKLLSAGLVTLTASVIGMQNANALPTFARQTGVSCAVCHNGNFAALTPFGRNFKLHGYTMTTEKTVEKKASEGSSEQLSLPTLPGLSAMMQISLTHTKKGSSGTQNNQVQAPEQLSLFLAGRLNNKMGIFSQATMDNTGAWGLDNTDIRYADSAVLSGKSLDYGFTFDNSPTVGDLWNSTPTWGYPYQGGTSDTPSILDGDATGGKVGVGAYGMLDNQFYGKFALYKSEAQQAQAGNTVISNAAPYWRLAWQQNVGGGYLMLGTYGMFAKVIPSAIATDTGIGGPEGKYLTTALDFQYERPLAGENSLVAHGSFTREKRSDLANDGSISVGNSPTYKYTKLDMELNMAGRYRPGVSIFNTSTGADKVDNTGYQLNMEYFLSENVQFQATYSGYTKKDGSTTNASDNNQIYLLMWIML
jgi:hypothetical protein